MSASTPTTVTYTYKHSHDCPEKDALVYGRPDIRQGVEWPIRPVCIITGVELELVKREVTYP